MLGTLSPTTKLTREKRRCMSPVLHHRDAAHGLAHVLIRILPLACCYVQPVRKLLLSSVRTCYPYCTTPHTAVKSSHQNSSRAWTYHTRFPNEVRARARSSEHFFFTVPATPAAERPDPQPCHRHRFRCRCRLPAPLQLQLQPTGPTDQKTPLFSFVSRARDCALVLSKIARWGSCLLCVTLKCTLHEYTSTRWRVYYTECAHARVLYS